MQCDGKGLTWSSPSVKVKKSPWPGSTLAEGESQVTSEGALLGSGVFLFREAACMTPILPINRAYATLPVMLQCMIIQKLSIVPEALDTRICTFVVFQMQCYRVMLFAGGQMQCYRVMLSAGGRMQCYRVMLFAGGQMQCYRVMLSAGGRMQCYRVMLFAGGQMQCYRVMLFAGGQVLCIAVCQGPQTTPKKLINTLLCIGKTLWDCRGDDGIVACLDRAVAADGCGHDTAVAQRAAGGIAMQTCSPCSGTSPQNKVARLISYTPWLTKSTTSAH